MSMPERLICECGCTFKSKAYLKVHLRTEKHQFMMDNAGDLRAWEKTVIRRGIITEFVKKLAKLDEGTDAWARAKRSVDRYQTEEQRVIGAPYEPIDAYEENGENQLVECACGCKVSRLSLYTHRGSDKHKRCLEMKEHGVEPKTRQEKRKETRRRYADANREKIVEQIKTYREKHYETILEQNRAYKQSNREKILEQSKSYRNKRITCECGCDVVRQDLSKHLRTLKHMQFVEQKARGDEAEPDPPVSHEA
jgi:hypothetical protein